MPTFWLLITLFITLFARPWLAVAQEAEGFRNDTQLKLSTHIAWKPPEDEAVVAELMYADNVSEQRVGYLIRPDLFYSENRFYNGEWNESTGRFSTAQYNDTGSVKVINKRQTKDDSLPTPGAWSASLIYNGFKAAKQGSLQASAGIEHQLGLKAQYQIKSDQAQLTSDRLVLQREIGFTQLYWQSHRLSDDSVNTSQRTEVYKPTVYDGKTNHRMIGQLRAGQLFVQPKEKAARELIGLQASRNIKPADNFLFFQGRLYSPAEISVLVNDEVRYTNVVNPGQVDLYNVPLEAGVNDVRVLVRQLDGTLQEFSSNFQVHPDLVPAGKAAWNFAAGFNTNKKAGEAHGSYNKGLNKSLTLGVAASVDKQPQISTFAAKTLKNSLVYAKARYGGEDFQKRAEIGLRRQPVNLGVDYNQQGWGGWINGRLGQLGFNIKKAFQSDFMLAQASWTQRVFNKAAAGLSCTLLRSDNGQKQYYCGVSVNFLLINGTPTSLSLSKASGVQDGYTMQGAYQGEDTQVRLLTSPTVDSISGKFPVGAMQVRANTDTLGGRAVGLDVTLAGVDGKLIGYGKANSLESATLAADLGNVNANVLFDGKYLRSLLATDAALDIQHKLTLDPESVPMDIDLRSFSQTIRTRIPGVYVIPFEEAQIETLKPLKP